MVGRRGWGWALPVVLASLHGTVMAVGLAAHGLIHHDDRGGPTTPADPGLWAVALDPHDESSCVFCGALGAGTTPPVSASPIIDLSIVADQRPGSPGESASTLPVEGDPRAPPRT